MYTLSPYTTILWTYLLHGLSSGCVIPQMLLVSDDPRRTCTDIGASKNMVTYSCASLIKGMANARIMYCPVEVCFPNNTWSKPSISCAMSECYHAGSSREYAGYRMCSRSGLPCQRWDTQSPNRHRHRKADMFPDVSVSMAAAFCRDPAGVRGAPWCYTTSPDRKWEFCDVKECATLPVSDGFCGTTKDLASSSQPDDDPIVDVEPSSDTCVGDTFLVTVNHRIQDDVGTDTQQRTATECAMHCARDDTCRAFAYQSKNKSCLIHGTIGPLIEGRGFKTGTKVCV